MKKIIPLFLLWLMAPTAKAASCNDITCQPMTARSVCDWTRNHPVDRPSLKDDDLQAVMFDSCLYLSRIECAVIGEGIFTVYQKLFDGFTSDNRKAFPTLVGFSGKALSTELNTNIFDNFSALQAKHTAVFSKIEKVQTDFSATVASVKTSADAKNSRKQLHERIKEIQGALFEASYYDSVFLNMLGDAGGQLLSMTAGAQKILNDNNCKVLEVPLTSLKDNASTFFMRIDELRKYVGLAAYKRGLLLEKFKASMDLAIYRAYANQTGKDIDAVLAELGATLKLDALLWEVTDWWFNATQNGIAGRLHTRYLQYRKPLQLLGEEMSRAKDFKNRIQKLEGISDAVKKQAEANLDVNIVEIQRNIDFITKRGGWDAALEAQKAAATKRDPLIPASNTACHAATQEFFDLAAAANSIETYELAEAKYKVHVDLCVKG